MTGTISAKDLIAINPGLWLENSGWIRDVGGKKLRPKLNVLQRRMNAIYMARFIENRPMRGIVVKPRKRGASTKVAAQHYTQLRRHPHEGFIIGDRAETSGVVFDILKYFAETDDFAADWGNQLDTSNSDVVKWSHGAKVGQGTAQGKASARGRTPQFVHETEKAHWEQAEHTSDALLNAVPDEGFTVVWVESTPFGFDNLFAKEWGAARWPTVHECPNGIAYWKQWASLCPDQPTAGRTDLDYIRCFAAWYEFDTPGAESFIRLSEDEKKHIQDTIDAESWYRGEAELLARYGNDGPAGLRLGKEVTRCDAWEQLAWRRSTIKNKCRSSLGTFNGEHPSDPKTCFVSTGTAVFDADALDRVFKRCEEVQPQYGQIQIIEREDERRASVTPCDEGMATVTIWEPPIVGCRYIVPVDLAEGEDQTVGDDTDGHSALVLRDDFVDQQRGGYAKKRLVARMSTTTSKMPLIPFARLCAALSLYYGNCLQIPEMNNSGLAYITAIKLNFPWVNLFKRPEIDPITGKKIREMDGWRTTDTAGYGGVRSQIIMNTQNVLRDDGIDIACPSVHSQLLNFVNKNGRMEAGIGHDDDVLSLSIGLANIGIGTVYQAAYRERWMPADVQRMIDAENAGSSDKLAMNW